MARRPKSPATEPPDAGLRRRRPGRAAAAGQDLAPERTTRREGRSRKRQREDQPEEATGARSDPALVVTDPDDPRSAPSAAGGWSETILTVPQALILPTNGRGMVQVGGVFDAQGGFVDQAVHWRRGQALLTPPKAPPRAKAARHLPGCWMWGGILLNHFGHFLTESTPRLWAIGALKDQLDGLVFLHKRNGEVANLHRTFMALMGLDLPIHIVSDPTVIEDLRVPGQGFGLGRISVGTAAFRAFFAEGFAPDIAPDGPERLYVSRSALGPRRGGVLGEEFIETHLARHGYEIFHPQHHPMPVQIARYRAAREIVALDGSALHLAAFCGRQGQRVAMIRRRNSSMSNAIALHLAAFTQAKPAVIDAVLADWVLKGRGGADRFSLGELDMPALQAQLQALGFIGAEPSPWPGLDPAWRDDQIARLRREFRKDYLRVPRPGPSRGLGAS